MIEAAAPLALFAAVLAALWLGFPVAFTLAGTAILFAVGAAAVGAFDLALLAAAPSRIIGALTTPELAAVPLFIFMGALMARSGVAEALLNAFAARLGDRRGGLAQATIGVGAVLSACTGVVAASVTALATLAGPTMRRAGYDDRLIAGTVCAAGALGQIAPPSILLIFLSVEIQSAHAAAQRSLGVFAPTPVTAADLFVAALAPSALLVVAFSVVVWLWGRRRPTAAPPTAPAARPSLALAGFAPLALILVALGSIILGVATPTEAAGLGAAGAALLAARRGGRADAALAAAAVGALLLAMLGRAQSGAETVGALLGAAALVWGLAVAIRRLAANGALYAAAEDAARLTVMAFTLLIGASLFGLVFRGLGGDAVVDAALSAAPGGVAGAVAATMVALFLLGFVFDFLEILFVVIPLTAPPLLAMGVDPLWLAVMIAVNLQTSFLTPPFGYALFYYRGAVPADSPISVVWRGAAPFVFAQLVVLALIAAFPEIATAPAAALFNKP